MSPGRSSVLWLGVGLLLGACSGHGPVHVVDQRLQGSYALWLQPPRRPAASDSRRPTVFFAPHRQPGPGVLGVWRRTSDTLELLVGTYAGDPGRADPWTGACSPVASLRLWVHGVTEDLAPQAIPLSNVTTDLLVRYSKRGDPAGRCPRSAEAPLAPPLRVELTLSGTLQLDVLACQDTPGDLGCALWARGRWSLSGNAKDGAPVFATQGQFEVRDSVVAE